MNTVNRIVWKSRHVPETPPDARVRPHCALTSRPPHLGASSISTTLARTSVRGRRTRAKEEQRKHHHRQTPPASPKMRVRRCRATPKRLPPRKPARRAKLTSRGKEEKYVRSDLARAQCLATNLDAARQTEEAATSASTDPEVKRLQVRIVSNAHSSAHASRLKSRLADTYRCPFAGPDRRLWRTQAMEN